MHMCAHVLTQSQGCTGICVCTNTSTGMHVYTCVPLRRDQMSTQESFLGSHHLVLRQGLSLPGAH